jgi:CRP/FNR family cyclic AMP-dependent transcriptional regulator
MTEFLDELAPDERTALFAVGRQRRVLAGGYLVTEGGPSDAVYIVLSGRVKVFSSTDRGGEVVLAVRGPGALIGELGAIDDRPRGASVTALEPVDALVLTGEAFRGYLHAHPRLLFRLLVAVTVRLRDADRKRVEFGAHDAVGRVASRLVELADRFGEPSGDYVRITLPITQDELAGWVGASREAVVKALRGLRDRGYIETRRRAVVVCDLAALRRRAL